MKMENIYIVEKEFEKDDFTQTPLPKGEYEGCSFAYCDFSNSVLSGVQFSDCTFLHCNFSLAVLANTAFRGAKFKECKMLGLHFETCNEFGFVVDFDTCILNHTSFYRKKLKKTVFYACKLQDVDFVESDLSGASFQQCDLLGAVFENTLLEKADFRNAYHYAVDPTKNRIKKARFSLTGLAGLLGAYDIEID